MNYFRLICLLVLDRANEKWKPMYYVLSCLNVFPSSLCMTHISDGVHSELWIIIIVFVFPGDCSGKDHLIFAFPMAFRGKMPRYHRNAHLFKNLRSMSAYWWNTEPKPLTPQPWFQFIVNISCLPSIWKKKHDEDWSCNEVIM